PQGQGQGHRQACAAVLGRPRGRRRGADHRLHAADLLRGGDVQGCVQRPRPRVPGGESSSRNGLHLPSVRPLGLHHPLAPLPLLHPLHPPSHPREARPPQGKGQGNHHAPQVG
ncbi:unnamed protein product, partial [Cyprideis torosa]